MQLVATLLLALLPALTVRWAEVPAGSVPQGAERVPMVRAELTASCAGPVTVESMTLGHRGKGARSDVLRVYVLSAGRRVTRAAGLRDASIVLPVRGLQIPACGTAELTVAADISASAAAASEHRLTLEAVEPSEGLAVLMPDQGDGGSRVVPRADIPSVTLSFRPLLTSLWYGERMVVGRFELANAGTADARVTAITFRNAGSAADRDLRNLFLESSRGERVSDVIAQMSGRNVRITLDPPILLGRNESKPLQIRADFRASVRKKVRWEIDEDSDIEAEEARLRR